MNMTLKDSSGSSYLSGDLSALWWTNLDGSGQGKLESNGQQIIYSGFENNVAFSPDGTSIAWIPVELEPGCYFHEAFWAPWVRDGVYTQHAVKKSPFFGKVVDTAYVENYVQNCFIMYVASLSELDNPTKIPLTSPFDPTKDSFMYQGEYDLRWWPDSSKILAFDYGGPLKWNNWEQYFGDYYPIALMMCCRKTPAPSLLY